jgi:hypothetical protein
MDELCLFRYVDVVYGCECDVVYGYIMKYIEYGCACGFKFPVVQLVIPISIKNSFQANLQRMGLCTHR